VAEQSASRLTGDDYQHLYSWFELLRLLDPECPYESAVVEHPDAGATDDITFHPRKGSRVPARYVQVKWHVDYRDQYSFESLTTITAGTKSLLQKLFESWKSLRPSGPIEVWFVSNYSPAPSPDLGAYITDRERRLTDDFFTKRSRSLTAARQRWVEVLGATPAELDAFCRDLRFELGYYPLERLCEQVDDRMGRLQLRMGENARAVALDEISRRIQRGGDEKVITREVLAEIIDRRGLRAQPSEAPEVRLVIHGWTRQGYDVAPTVELDWTKFFDREHRRVASPETWTRTLLPELRSARERLAALSNGKYADVRGKLPLSAAMAVGFALPEVAGFRLRAEQPTGGETHLWRSDAPASQKTFVVVKEIGEPGEDIVIGLSITGRGLTEMQQLMSALRASALVYAEPEGGTGPASIGNAGDVVALARSAKTLIRMAKEKYRSSRVHLVLYGPWSFALFLGQVLNAVGIIVSYERTVDGRYQESVTLATG
jgi:CBASS immunity sensor of nucleotide second messenger signals